MARPTEDIFPKRLFSPQIFYILRGNINSRRLSSSTSSDAAIQSVISMFFLCFGPRIFAAFPAICFVLFYLCAVLSVVAVDLLRMILPLRTPYWL